MKSLLRKYRRELVKENKVIMKYVFRYIDSLDTFNNLGKVAQLNDVYHEIGFMGVLVRMRGRTQEEKLDEMIRYYEYLPKQGTEQWLKLRIHTIGGSEMATVLGENKYQKLKDFVGGKLGIDEYKFSGNLATRWGKMFEPAFRQYVEFLFNNSIYECGSIPGYQENGIVLQSYSPDGIGVASIERISELIDINSEQYFSTKASHENQYIDLKSKFKKSKRMTILYEFKCPLRAGLDGRVPDHYISQPLTGLCTIPITHMAIFMQGVYRRCSVRDFLPNPNFDTDFHSSNYGSQQIFTNPILLGFIGLFKTSQAPSAPKTKAPKGPTEKEEIKELIEKEINNKYSEFWGMKMSMMNCVNNCKLISCFCDNADDAWEVYLSMVDEPEKASKSKIIKSVFMQTAAKLEIKVADLSDMKKEDFEILMETAEKSENIQMYYPEQIYYCSGQHEKYLAQHNYKPIVGNSQNWLKRQVDIFLDMCNEKNYSPIGIMPYKLFESTCVPVYKQEDYIEQNIDKIRYAHSIVTEIRTKSDRANYAYELEKRFPGRNTLKYIPYVSTAKITTEYADMDDFFSNI